MFLFDFKMNNLKAEKDNVMMEFALNGISNNLFTSTYTYYIPNKE